ncbi:MAG TPA: glutathione S-transferase family protein [Rhizobiaceae bacterium]|nr:glutathione S-transferase family protein [Rhizobiaceae bacterium]
MTTPRLFGASYSVYVRIARLALEEKGVDYELVPVDIFDKDKLPADYAQRHPFLRIPAFEHGTLKLFETAAITQYVDEAFDGLPLQPSDPRKRALMSQAIGMLDAYAYRALVWSVYVERVSKPKQGEASDEARIAAGLQTAETCLAVLARTKGQSLWLVGNDLTLADLHAAPIFAYFLRAPEGRAMIAEHPALEAWWAAVSSRPSFQATEFDG